MDKDEFLKDCINEAYNVSIGMNTKRMFNFKAIFEEYSKINFGETEEDREELINRLIQLFIDIEELCRLIEKGKLKESSVRLAGKVCVW